MSNDTSTMTNTHREGLLHAAQYDAKHHNDNYDTNNDMINKNDKKKPAVSCLS